MWMLLENWWLSACWKYSVFWELGQYYLRCWCGDSVAIGMFISVAFAQYFSQMWFLVRAVKLVFSFPLWGLSRLLAFDWNCTMLRILWILFQKAIFSPFGENLENKIKQKITCSCVLSVFLCRKCLLYKWNVPYSYTKAQVERILHNKGFNSGAISDFLNA